MLFKQRFHAGIRDGSITRTVRTWKTPKVKPGGTYRLGAAGALEVRRVAEVALSDVTAADATRCGFADRDELVRELQRTSKTKLTARSRVCRVDFRFVAVEDPRAARRRDASASALDEVAARLERMDRLSRRGPWTKKVLELVARHPRVAASKLAPRLDRETRAFKADVRKLKELGLTVSHETGYSLSPRGEALLARLDGR
jgi:hypothetical protein